MRRYLNGLRNSLIMLVVIFTCGLLYGPARADDGPSGENGSGSVSAATTGIPDLDAMIRASESHEDGWTCYDETEKEPDCEGYYWFRSVWVEVKPVSSRMISVIEHLGEANGGGPPYHHHLRRYIWGIRENRILNVHELLANSECLDTRPGNDVPELRELYDWLNEFRPVQDLTTSFEPTPEGFALWVYYAGITGPGEEEFPLSVLEGCGVRKEFWEGPVREE